MSKYDNRNTLNDLTGKEWLKLTSSFWVTEKCKDDKEAMKHPAPFLIKDTEKLIKMFTKKDMKVLDMFCGSGTTLISACNLQRKGIGIDINKEYKELAIQRLQDKKYREGVDFEYLVGDAVNVLKTIDSIDYIVTSPPYHNILRNTSSGIRTDKIKKGFRNSGRTGVVYYTEEENDLGNKENYEDFLIALTEIMKLVYKILNQKRYCTIVMSDFTIDKKEVNIQGDIVRLMISIGFEFSGTIVLLQPNKPLYPFGYPYAYKINHHHQNIINFRKI